MRYVLAFLAGSITGVAGLVGGLVLVAKVLGDKYDPEPEEDETDDEPDPDVEREEWMRQ